MIKELYFFNYNDHLVYNSYVYNEPYILRFQNKLLTKQTYYCFGREYSKGTFGRSGYRTYVLNYEKEQWFSMLSHEDKCEAIWMMHD